MKISTPVLIGGAAVVGLYIYAKNQNIPITTAATNLLSSGSNLVQSGTTYPYLVSGAPPLPAAFDQNYVDQYILPAMIQVNPNVANPGYTLSQSDATQYMANYLEIAQWANSSDTLKQPNIKGSVLAACQYHWHTYGVVQNYTFMVLPWGKTANWGGPAQPNPKASSGSTFGSILLDVATVAVKVLGPNDAEPMLNNAEVQLIVCGAAVAKDILPMFANAAPGMVDKINNRINAVIAQYN